MAQWIPNGKFEDFSEKEKEECEEDYKNMLTKDFQKKWGMTYNTWLWLFWKKSELNPEIHLNEWRKYWKEVKELKNLSEKTMHDLVNKKWYTLTQIKNSYRRKWKIIINLDPTLVSNCKRKCQPL